MSKSYYTLLVREGRNEPWEIHFGDYDRETVDVERDDCTEHEYPRSDTMVITTGDDQADIEAKVRELNNA